MASNIGDLLYRAAGEDGHRLAIIEYAVGGRAEYTYRDVHERACRVAAALRKFGWPPGTRIALCAENSASFVSAWFGIVYGGMVAVPVPILSGPAEIALRLKHAKCSVVIVDAPRLRNVETSAAGITPAPVLLPLASAVAGPDSYEPPLTVPSDHDALILYTSGTMAQAKGACITHASLLAHTHSLVEHTLRLGPEDRVFGALPLTHSYGIRMVMLAAIHARARSVLTPRFHADAAMRLLRTEGITWLPAVPTMLAAFADTPPNLPLDSLRWCLSAGAPLPRNIAERATARLGAEVRQGYGLTEASFSTIDAPPEAPALGTVGKPVHGVTVRVVDGQGLDAGIEGEVLVRGPNVMRGYLDDLEETQQAVRDGWLRTGDVGRFDERGRLILVDRIKDLIIRGGYNIYPSEVEDALSHHPDVSQVAVIGRPDDYYGEEVVAILVLQRGANLNAADLLDFAQSRLGKGKAPREVAIVENMPLGPSGKILRRELRKQVEADLLEVTRLKRA